MGEANDVIGNEQASNREQQTTIGQIFLPLYSCNKIPETQRI